jgi:hypothetical protein
LSSNAASVVSAGSLSSRVAHVDLARWIVADEDYGEAGGDAVTLLEGLDALGDFSAQVGGNGLAVDQSGFRRGYGHRGDPSIEAD